jgi:diguanylate cyclase (GGDEF)-like protein
MFDDQPTTGAMTAAPSSPTGGDEDAADTLTHSTVMMIDDDPITLEVIQAFLAEAGYRKIVTVSQPAQALRKIRHEQPDVVLLDLLMPGVSGFDILRAMSGDAELRYVPVIMLTAASDAETKLRALELGATDFLAKPVDPSELTLRLRNTLAFKAYRDRLAHFDSLTGLPNRRAFIERLRGLLRQEAPLPRRMAVLHIDLDRFKEINDTLGFSAGDTLLNAVTGRLRAVLRSTEKSHGAGAGGRSVLSRFGSDEFIVLTPDLPSNPLPEVLARHIVLALAAPITIGKHDLFVSASIGIAISPDDGVDAITLLKNADVAMHAAKQQGGNGFVFYSSELNMRSLERLTLEHGLRQAVSGAQLRLHYQPQVEVASGRIVGFEALMRWQHPELGLLMPDRFISIAEDAGIISELGDWALFEACAQLKAWEQAGFGDLVVSVNAAAAQLQQAHFPETIARALTSAGIVPGSLMLEITESMLIGEGDQSVAVLNRIKALGVGLSLDDFGTGYSSFSHLKRLRIDEIKIDRAFVADMDSSTESAAIVAAILSLATGLGLKIVAEGVETEAQLAGLAARSCQNYQGYHFSRPLPVDEITALLARHRAPKK